MVNHLIVGDTKLLLFGLKEFLSCMEDVEVIQLSLHEKELLEYINTELLDFIWFELSGHDRNPRIYYKKIMTSCPRIKIIIFCDNKDPRIIKELLQAGISGYLLPNCKTYHVEEAINSSSKGNVFIDPQLRRYFTDFILDTDKMKGNIIPLTRREKEVLKLIIEENTTQEIANKLYISFCTVETHRLHLIQKMGVKNTAGLVREALIQQFHENP